VCATNIFGGIDAAWVFEHFSGVRRELGFTDVLENCCCGFFVVLFAAAGDGCSHPVQDHRLEVVFLLVA